MHTKKTMSLLQRVVSTTEADKLYPRRYRGNSTISSLGKCPKFVTNVVYETHSHLVADWNMDVLAQAAVQTHAEAISRIDSALDNCFRCKDNFKAWYLAKSCV